MVEQKNAKSQEECVLERSLFIENDRNRDKQIVSCKVNYMYCNIDIQGKLYKNKQLLNILHFNYGALPR